MSFSIEGRVAIVTGAANGLGLAIARHFVDEGAQVMFADRDEARLKQEFSDFSDDGPAAYFVGDLREKLTISNLISATIDRYDRVDILINAARQIKTQDPLDPDDDCFHTMFEQNVTATLRLIQYVARRMKNQKPLAGSECRGAIVNFSSIAAKHALTELMGYNVSMAALEAVTRNLAVALAPDDIRVNAVSFGSVLTSSLEAALRDDPTLRSAIIDKTPLGWIAEPDYIAQAAQFLASDAAQFVTGEVLTIDGGRSLVDPAQVPAH